MLLLILPSPSYAIPNNKYPDPKVKFQQESRPIIDPCIPLIHIYTLEDSSSPTESDLPLPRVQYYHSQKSPCSPHTDNNQKDLLPY
jgi:hypothetical protein